jgi:hypothetical protein
MQDKTRPFLILEVYACLLNIKQIMLCKETAYPKVETIDLVTFLVLCCWC